MGNLSKVPHTYFTTSNYLLSHISLSSAIPIFTSSHFLPIHPLRYENGSEFFTSSPKKLKASVETWDASWQTVSKSIIFLLINHNFGTKFCSIHRHDLNLVYVSFERARTYLLFVFAGHVVNYSTSFFSEIIEN